MNESDNVVRVYMLQDLEKENKLLRELCAQQLRAIAFLLNEAVAHGADAKELLEEASK